ncbi:PP2C family serine/threonine-protein phosphatase [Piscinibacter sakaiensis]|uniref:Protein phosphatase 2C-like n=1 Tax=Piscinibacter sakaiensis TaxID=1547922 RepID=A0A0K8P5P9_PISS1|nr:PP2C family serine/threonine-protein phosphatase [Piscinibacter sakaiensis]GAP38043.1 protein phosphatase 2C-like [Piscinibacter sakaiensis]
MRFNVYQLSRKGGREKNEDRMGYTYTRRAGLFAVADGMGGHPEGEVAAQLALQTLAGRFQRECRPRLDDPLAFLQEAIVGGHHQLQRYGERRAMSDTPRTTIVACLLQGSQAWWAHCGDSRLYHVRDGALRVRTRDHSYAELQLSSAGGLRPERYNRNVLFTCLGSPGMPVIDASGPQRLEPGDRLLLCSDGLWGNLSDAQIVTGLGAGPLDEAVPALVDQALRQGGPRSDNVTVLAVEWEGDEPADPADDEDGAEQAAATPSSDAGFATTIRPAFHGEDSQPLPAAEVDIDRSIDEINDAIRRRAAPPPRS